MTDAHFILKKKKDLFILEMSQLRKLSSLFWNSFNLTPHNVLTSIEVVVIFLLIQGANSDSKNILAINSEVIMDNVDK